MTNETRTIEAADLIDFTFKIQEAILDGYRLSEVSDLAPQNIGWVFVTTMEKPEYQTMPIAEMTLTINVDTEQAVKNLEEVANAAVKYHADNDAIMPADLESYKVLEGAITVESNIVEPKTTQRRGRK